MGRVISKKNSKRWIVRGGRKFLVPSVRYEQFLTEALYSLKPQIKRPITGPFDLVVHLYIPGKVRADGDNLFTSILDVLQEAGAYADDIMCLHGEWYKHPGAGGWCAKIQLTPYKGKYG